MVGMCVTGATVFSQIIANHLIAEQVKVNDLLWRGGPCRERGRRYQSRHMKRKSWATGGRVWFDET